MVSPYLDLREELKSQSEVKEFYLETSHTRGRENFFVKGFEAPVENFVHIDTGNTIEECLERIYDSIAQGFISIPTT
jgi:hypothetical protein